MKLTIENFKCFERQEVAFRSLTILAGANSVGKSSVIQSLLLSRQAIERLWELSIGNDRESGTIKSWQGQTLIPLNNFFRLMLGNTAEVLNKDAAQDYIKFNFVNEHKSAKFIFSVPRNVGAYDLELTELVADFSGLDISILHPRFYYLNAERIGPRLDYKVESLRFSHVGYDGALTIQTLHRIHDNEIDIARAFDKEKLLRYSMQVSLWMQYITPGVEISVPNLYEKVRTAQMNFGESSPTNVGFGISYVLPIVVNGLLADKGSMLIVENPEAHLHPSGQSRIGIFLSKVAAAGVQVIIETHSEHVINGIRIACLEKNFELSNNDVLINFFQKDRETGKPVVQPIDITETGDLSRFPRDFFDQTQQDLVTLIKLKREKNDWKPTN